MIFSDGEHGHELFAWQHRYYGSDASVHLGATGKNGAKSVSRGRREYRGSRARGAPSSKNRVIRLKFVNKTKLLMDLLF